MLAVETAWNNPAIDALVWVVAILGLLWWLLRREAKRVQRDPLADPISHVRPVPTPLDANGRVLKIGVNCHARACVDDEGRVECVCGLADREAEARGGAA